jgi:hypothetical protein
MHMQHPDLLLHHPYGTLENSETSETLDTYVSNMRFVRNIPCCLEMEARRRMKFTGVELASGTELAAPVKKAAAYPRVGEGHCRQEAR